MRKTIALLCVVYPILPVNASEKLIKIHNDLADLYTQKQIEYGDAEIPVDDKKFTRKIRSLCRALQKYDDTLVVDSRDYDWVYGAYRLNESDFCDSVHIADLYYIMFAFLEKIKLEYVTIDDINKAHTWPRHSLVWAARSVCYPVVKDLSFAGYLVEFHGGYGRYADVVKYGHQANVFPTAIMLDNKAEISSVCMTRKEKELSPDNKCIEPSAYNMQGCNSLIDIAENYKDKFSYKDALGICMQHINDKLYCYQFINVLADDNWHKFSSNALAQIEKITGTNHKVYSLDKKFYIEYEYNSYGEMMGDEISKKMPLYVTGTGECIGVCDMTENKCDVSNPLYEKYQFIVTDTIWTVTTCITTSDGFKRFDGTVPPVVLSYFDYGNYYQETLSKSISWLQNQLTELNACMQKKDWAPNDEYTNQYSWADRILLQEKFCQENYPSDKDFVECMYVFLNDAVSDLHAWHKTGVSGTAYDIKKTLHDKTNDFQVMRSILNNLMEKCQQ